MSLTISSIRRGFDGKGRPRTLIRHGKTEIEIPGGDAELKAWIADQVARVDEAAIAGMTLAKQIESDPMLKTLTAVVGKELQVAATVKAIEGVAK